MTVAEIIRRDHGSNCFISLQGDAEAVVSAYQALVDNGQMQEHPYVWTGHDDPVEVAANEAYNRMRDMVLIKWLRSVSREQMLGTVNALSQIMGGGSIEYLPGESIGPIALAKEWNKANPESDPIAINTAYLM